jgi:hypothetical protein
MEQNYIYGTGNAATGSGAGVSSGPGSNQVRLFLTKMMHDTLSECVHTLPTSLPAELEAANPGLHLMWDVLSAPRCTGQTLSVLAPPMLAFLSLLWL